MGDANPLGERGRSLEEDYFRRRDRELIERMRAASEAEESRRQMGSLTGLQDADVAKLQALGRNWLAALDDFRNWLIREAA